MWGDKTTTPEVDWAKERQVVLTYLHSKYDTMSEFMRNRPFLLFNDPATMETIQLSPADVINEVNNLSDIGKKIIVAELKKMGRLQ